MNVTLDKIDDVTAILNVSIEENDYQEKVTNELKQFGRTHTIPGFRKGHISIDQLRRRFGKQVKSDVINQDAATAAIDYINENKISILGQPLPVEVKEINLADKDYTFQYEIGIAPEINLTLDKSVNIPYYTIAVDDNMLKEQDEHLRERFGAQVPGDEVDAKALVKGAIMELNEDGTIKDGEDAIQVNDGIVAPMFFKSKEQANLFLGKKVGDKVRFNPWATCEGSVAELSSMLHVDKDKAADIKADFELAISEIIVLKLAEHNEDFFKDVFGADKVHSEEEYNAALKEMIAGSLAPNSEMLFRRDAQKFFLDKYGKMALPVAFLKKWMKVRNPEIKDENLDKEFESMTPALEWQLIREKIAEMTDMKIEDADLLNLAKQIAANQFAQYGMTNMDEESITSFAKNILNDKDYRPKLVEQVGDIKLFNIIKASVTLDEKTVSLDEFKKLAEAEA